MIWTASVVKHIVRPDDTRDPGPALETLIRTFGVRDGIRRRVRALRALPPEAVLAAVPDSTTHPSGTHPIH